MTNKLATINKKEIFFYCLGGGTGALVNFGVTYLIVSIAGLNYIIGLTAGSFVNLTFNFLFHRALTFKVKTEPVKRAVIYYIFGVILFFITLALAVFLKSTIGLNYLIAQIIATGASVIINFFASKLIVFKK